MADRPEIVCENVNHCDVDYYRYSGLSCGAIKDSVIVAKKRDPNDSKGAKDPKGAKNSKEVYILQKQFADAIKVTNSEVVKSYKKDNPPVINIQSKSWMKRRAIPISVATAFLGNFIKKNPVHPSISEITELKEVMENENAVLEPTDPDDPNVNKYMGTSGAPRKKSKIEDLSESHFSKDTVDFILSKVKSRKKLGEKMVEVMGEKTELGEKMKDFVLDIIKKSIDE